MMASNDTVQPAQQVAGTFDSILAGIVAGVEVYRAESTDSYNTAAMNANPSLGSNQKTLFILAAIVVGIYLLTSK